MIKKILIAMLAILPALPICSQDNTDWEPLGNWPFINRQFRTATVYTGLFNRTKTVVPCNIHVGKQSLWYTQNDTLMEAIPGTVLRVEFPNGDVYTPVGSQHMFGRIVREDTVQGQIARVICVRSVDQKALDQRGVDILNNTQNILQGASALGVGFGSWASALSDANGAVNEEELPLPMTNQFYFQVRGEIFPATNKQILAHISDAKRKKEYRAFTRSAEIISTNETSMLKVWKEFFLK